MNCLLIFPANATHMIAPHRENAARVSNFFKLDWATDNL